MSVTMDYVCSPPAQENLKRATMISLANASQLMEKSKETGSKPESFVEKVPRNLAFSFSQITKQQSFHGQGAAHSSIFCKCV